MLGNFVQRVSLHPRRMIPRPLEGSYGGLFSARIREWCVSQPTSELAILAMMANCGVRSNDNYLLITYCMIMTFRGSRCRAATATGLQLLPDNAHWKSAFSQQNRGTWRHRHEFAIRPRPLTHDVAVGSDPSNTGRTIAGAIQLI
jgi:hypothetical protein